MFATVLLLLLGSGPRHDLHHHHVAPKHVVQSDPWPAFKLDPRLIGTWWPELDSLKLEFPGHPELAKQMGDKLDDVEQQLAYAHITFNADGTSSNVDPSGQESKGYYRVIGNIVKTRDANGGKKDQGPFITISQDGEHLVARIHSETANIQLSFIKM